MMTTIDLKSPEWVDLQKRMVGWRRDIHRNPEIGNHLPRTSAYVQKVLKELGISFQLFVEGNSLVGLIPGREEGRTIALRADMDGLPVREDTGLPFASENGCMHACGHDGHTAMLLGAAAWLSAHREAFSGQVKLFFQSGEEYPGGAEPMIRECCLENPHVDAVFGMHAGQMSPEVPKGKIAYIKGPIMAAMDRLYIKVLGRGGHGAYPHTCVDPIVLASEIVLALQTLISRELNPTEAAVLSITRISGGFNQNIIPDTVELEGTVRTLHPETRVWLAERIRAVAEGLAAARGARVEIEHSFNYPAVINDDALTDLVVNAARKVLSAEALYPLKSPVMSGEDFAFYQEKVPGCFVFMSNPGLIQGKFNGHHSPRFDLDESMFSAGAALHCQTALDFLNRC